MNKLGQGWVRFNEALRYAAGMIVLMMMLTVSFEVVMRYFFSAPTTWVADISTYSIVFIVFLTAPWLLLKDKHVKMEAVLTLLSPKQKRRMYFVTSVVALVYTAVLTCLTWDLALDALREHHSFAGGITIPRFPILVIIPIGAFLLSVQYLINIVKFVTSRRER